MHGSSFIFDLLKLSKNVLLNLSILPFDWWWYGVRAFSAVAILDFHLKNQAGSTPVDP